jgi:hypothetical protein
VVDTDSFTYVSPGNDGSLEWRGYDFDTPIRTIEYHGDFVVTDGMQVLTSPCTPGVTMYGGNGNGSGSRGELIIIDQTNGSGTVVGTPVSGVGLTGIAFHPDGRLFASTIAGGGSTSTLIRINPDTGGLISTIGSITDNGTPISIGDLSFQPGTGVLYGIRSNSDNQGHGGFLYTIDITTGVATFIGDTGAGVGGGIGFAPDGTLYQLAYNSFLDFPSLNTISPVDASRINTVPVDRYYDGLGVRSDGILFATPGSSDAVYTINPVTGASTFVGFTGQGNLNSHSNGNTYGNSDSYSNGNTYRNCHSNGNAYRYCDVHPDSNSNVHPDTHVSLICC